MSHMSITTYASCQSLISLFTESNLPHEFKVTFCVRGVVGLTGAARRNYMVPVPRSESLEQLNETILRQCVAYGNHKVAGRDRSVNELYEEEKGHLLALADEVFSNVRITDGRDDKYATVIVDKNRYSVPSRYAGLGVKVLLHVDRVEIFTGGKKLATHQRVYGNNKWCLDPDHYLELIQQRPMAFNSARAIREWRANWPRSLELLLERFCLAQGETKGIKDFINVLMLYRDHQAGAIEVAVELAVKNHISASAGVRHLLASADETNTTVAPLASWSSLPPVDVSVYGELGGVQ